MGPTVTAVLALVLAWLAKWIVSLIRHRNLHKRLPGPPHHPVFGHLISVGRVTAKLPNRVHPQAFATALQEAYDLPPVFYMDIYPASRPLIMVLDPELGIEISSNPTLCKPREYHHVVEPLTGPSNLLLSEGAEWKKQRAIFNPGFSIQHLMSQVPIIVDILQNFVKVLEQHAEKEEIFRVEEEATKATVDVIGKVVLDHDFKSFAADNEFLTTMRNILSWEADTQSLNPFHQYHPIRPIAFKYYKKKLDQYIGRILDERFRSRSVSRPAKKKRTSIDLALEAYADEVGQRLDLQDTVMDEEFKRTAIDNMLVLAFAGHDTTSSTICYAYHMLHKHPDELAKVRLEMDTVFGAGVNASEALKRDPYLINRCEYTLAVIKETLRLWSPASSARMGRKGYFIKDPITGQMLPTEGSIVWAVIAATHRSPRYWGPDVNEFKPSRFLAANSHKLVSNAFRPFEKGPRNCIGQELAMLEVKIVLALTIREFDIWAVFDELDKVSKDGSIWVDFGAWKKGPQECYGERMYPVLMATAKPVEGMPARVKRRERGGHGQGP